MTLLLGMGAVAVGIHLRRRIRQAPVPVGRGTDRHGRRATYRIIDRATPYFLIFWGSTFLLGTVIAVIDR
ncbi:hypothetical protein ACFVXE_15720 [Streptomyces sp. NPDC058231]|uniref:hypothetical protein n=1 Tax=Streptomyces sp. NPDC058231 TaxID=3346392 RepID=UPI0036EFB589